MGPAQLDGPGSSARSWFARRTWRHADFDREDLARRASDTSVAVVIPALDEVATVGDVVAVAVDLGALVDDVVVVDGGSTDGTAAAAAAAGARVIDQHRALPEAGPGRGKGDALWKGLAATTSDLVVFIDADLRDVDDRYVVGLLGPLLTDPDIAFVKACYDRPLDLGDERRPVGGGRVTELLARPLLDAFWPDLAGIAQPLSGEYAGRRDALVGVPFVQGWGVELGLLIDLAGHVGVDAIGQVDLGSRSHAHQPLDALGRMAAEILQVAAARLRSEGRLTGGTSAVLQQTVRDADGALQLVGTDVALAERPPLGALA